MADIAQGAAPRRRCVFCGSRDKKISNEHIIGDRWSDVFSETRVKHRRFGWKLDNDGTPSAPWDQAWRSTDGLDFKVNAVCRDCNSGWMADLDTAVDPLLRPMVMDAKHQLLGPAETASLARWIAKTAIMIVSSQNAEWTFTDEQAATVMAGEFPQGFRVWALAWLGDRMVHLWSTPLAGPPPERKLAHCITSFTFGHMYFLAIHTPVPGFPVNLEWLLGPSVDARQTSWSCPPDLSTTRPDMLPEYHAGAVREWVRYLDELGVWAPVDGQAGT